jgi:hypothetical protein
MAESQASITLQFSGQDGQILKRGPYRTFCLQGETMREDVGGAIIAVHEDHQWQVAGRKFSRVDCDCSVRIECLRVDGKRSKRYGPFVSFSCMDGIAHANHEIFAFADRSIGDWYCHADGLHWAILVIQATD